MLFGSVGLTGNISEVYEYLTNITYRFLAEYFKLEKRGERPSSL